MNNPAQPVRFIIVLLLMCRVCLAQLITLNNIVGVRTNATVGNSLTIAGPDPSGEDRLVVSGNLIVRACNDKDDDTSNDCPNSESSNSLFPVHNVIEVLDKTTVSPTTQVSTTPATRKTTTETGPPTTTTTTISKITTVKTPTVQNICDGCMLTNGVGYIEHPADCGRFYQCVALYGFAHTVATERICAPGLHWNQHILSCDYPHNVQCRQDPCSSGSQRVPGNCRKYLDCASGNAVPKCCPRKQSYDARARKCRIDYTCDDECKMRYNEIKASSHGPCNMRAVPGEKFVFQQKISKGGWILQKCPPKTAFNEEGCGCVSHKADILDKQCRPELFLPFRFTTNDESGNSVHVSNEGVQVVHGVAVFTGRSRLVINRFSNAWFGHTVIIHIRYKALESSRGSVLCNGDCAVAPSLYIGHAPDGGTEVYTKTYGSSAVNFTLPKSGEKWQDVTYVLHDRTLQAKVGKWKKEHKIKGPVEVRQRALSIGKCGEPNGFKGFIDQISLYLCRPGHL